MNEKIVKIDGEMVTLYEHEPQSLFTLFTNNLWGPIKNRKARQMIIHAEIDQAMKDYDDDQYFILLLYSSMTDRHLEALFEKVKPMFKMYNGTEQQAKKFACYYYANNFKDKFDKPIKGRLANLVEAWIKNEPQDDVKPARAVINNKVRNRRTIGKNRAKSNK